MTQLPLVPGMRARAVRERRRSTNRRRYPHIPSEYFREMNRLWMILVNPDMDYERAAKAWAAAWENYVVRNGEDPLRFSLDMAGCLETLSEQRARGVHWLQGMSYETVVKLFDRYRAGFFCDTTAEVLHKLLAGDV